MTTAEIPPELIDKMVLKLHLETLKKSIDVVLADLDPPPKPMKRRKV